MPRFIHLSLLLFLFNSFENLFRKLLERLYIFMNFHSFRQPEVQSIGPTHIHYITAFYYKHQKVLNNTKGYSFYISVFAYTKATIKPQTIPYKTVGGEDPNKCFCF